MCSEELFQPVYTLGDFPHKTGKSWAKVIATPCVFGSWNPRARAHRGCFSSGHYGRGSSLDRIHSESVRPESGLGRQVHWQVSQGARPRAPPAGPGLRRQLRCPAPPRPAPPVWFETLLLQRSRCSPGQAWLPYLLRTGTAGVNHFDEYLLISVSISRL
jgi:hypothetical protein